MKINYRPEINGLRAIAVISVIIYHEIFYDYGHYIREGAKYFGEKIYDFKLLNVSKNN